MKYIVIILTFFIFLEAGDLKNKLLSETSPYLQQHATNPVNWMPWGDEAFAKAKKQNKAVFLSIGYSTCHWCHVMAKESFENKAIAELFNKYFVCVKVDREEMPHLDSYYQQLHLKVKKRSGGWPLSAFLTYEKKPFYIGTYIPANQEHFHEGLDTLLPKIYYRYKNDYKDVLKEAEYMESLMNKAQKTIKNDNAKISLDTLSSSIQESYDDIYEGFGRNKKFPEASKLALMMDLALLKNNEKLQKKSLDMLDAMAMRGLYDHVEGGFFRYSVDAAWEIPHFEKMLYNQAELIPLYVRAYLTTKKELYRNVVKESIEMLDRRFVKDKLYYSASDADTNHEEGTYFTFTTDEIEQALKNNPYAPALKESFYFDEFGNFKSKVHLGFTSNDRVKGFKKFKEELLKMRKTKEYPFIDKKINTAWNAMMIEALYKASVLDKKYAKKADEHLESLLAYMFEREELYHQALIGTKPTQLGLLEDYSFLISALLAAYEVEFDEDKLSKAEYFLNEAKRKFYRDGIWYHSDDKLGIKADINDKYYTSPLSRMIQNILKLASLRTSFRYEKLAVKTLESQNALIEKEQSNAPAASIAFLMQKERVVTIKNNKESLKRDFIKIKKIKYPYVLIKKKDMVSEYLACTMRSCFAVDKEFSKIKINIEENIRN
ncbi:thioredoxin domain-containing protein [Sulfurimonas sp.]|uniref:thioredoxin domain-containing protein n=1 Tax=Sulfurimonas sp. TaxID=2022749 RepID=UPI00356B3DA0